MNQPIEIGFQNGQIIKPEKSTDLKADQKDDICERTVFILQKMIDEKSKCVSSFKTGHQIEVKELEYINRAFKTGFSQDYIIVFYDRSLFHNANKVVVFTKEELLVNLGGKTGCVTYKYINTIYNIKSENTLKFDMTSGSTQTVDFGGFKDVVFEIMFQISKAMGNRGWKCIK